MRDWDLVGCKDPNARSPARFTMCIVSTNRSSDMSRTLIPDPISRGICEAEIPADSANRRSSDSSTAVRYSREGEGHRRHATGALARSLAAAAMPGPCGDDCREGALLLVPASARLGKSQLVDAAKEWPLTAEDWPSREEDLVDNGGEIHGERDCEGAGVGRRRRGWNGGGGGGGGGGGAGGGGGGGGWNGGGGWRRGWEGEG